MLPCVTFECCRKREFGCWGGFAGKKLERRRHQSLKPFVYYAACTCWLKLCERRRKFVLLMTASLFCTEPLDDFWTLTWEVGRTGCDCGGWDGWARFCLGLCPCLSELRWAGLGICLSFFVRLLLLLLLGCLWRLRLPCQSSVSVRCFDLRP